MSRISPQETQTDAYFAIFACCHKWCLNRHEFGKAATYERLMYKIVKKS